MRSNLKPLARLVVHVLLAKSNKETAEIDPEFTPSLTTIEDATGMSRSAVADHLAYLERLSWVKRSKPARSSRIDRTRYALLVGQDDPERNTSPPRGLVRDADHSPPADTETVVHHTDCSSLADSPHDGLGVVRHTDSSSPPHGPATSSTTNNITKTSSSKRSSTASPERPDVEEICRYLVEKIVENGSKKPTITKTWRDEARRLIDRDGRSVEQIKRAIDWCQADKFWRSNILSMPTLREQYDRLRLAAKARGTPVGTRTPGVGSAHVNPADYAAAYPEKIS